MDQEKFKKIIEKSNNILVFPNQEKSVDSLTSSFAFYFFLKNLQKKVTLYLDEALPEKLSFLKKPKNIISNLAGSRDFIIIFNTQKNKILSVNTNENKNEFRIQVTPEKGSIHPKDFSFIPAEFKYDLIITLGVPSLESLKNLYFDNTDLFFEVPKINIDCHSENEEFGQLNLVDITASSTSEIITEIFLNNFENNLNQKIAQNLLTGIIASTESFQKPTTTPQSMMLSAQLMKYKANQSTIIRYLYKTKSLSFLKLWGRIMARLNNDKDKKLVWSLASSEDFIKSHADENDIPFVIEEIQKNFSDAQVFAIIYIDKENRVKIRLKFNNEKIAEKICSKLEIEHGKDVVKNFENLNLLEAEKKLLKSFE